MPKGSQFQVQTSTGLYLPRKCFDFHEWTSNCDGSARNASVVQYFIRLSVEEVSSHAGHQRLFLHHSRTSGIHFTQNVSRRRLA